MIQEIRPALTGSGAETGEIIVADVGAKAVLCCVARARVDHRDPGRGLMRRRLSRCALRHAGAKVVSNALDNR